MENRTASNLQAYKERVDKSSKHTTKLNIIFMATYPLGLTSFVLLPIIEEYHSLKTTDSTARHPGT